MSIRNLRHPFQLIDDLPIALRLAVAFSLVLATMAVLIGYALHQIDGIADTSRRVAQSSMHRALRAQQVRERAEEGAQELYSLFVLPLREQRMPVYARIDAARRAEDSALAELLADAPATEVVARVTAARAAFRDAFGVTVDLVELDPERARADLLEHTEPALRELLAALDRLADVEAAQANNTLSDLHRAEAQGARRIVALGALAVLVALLTALFIARSMLRRLAQASQVARDVAAGRLDGELPRAGRDEIGLLVGVMAEMRSNIAERESRIAELAYRDRLTGLANRTLFGDRLQQAVATAIRNGQGLTVLMLDLDRFKSVNDVLGHPFGDRVLKQVATRLAETFQRDSDTIARLGGDEFAILLPTQGKSDAVAAAQRILAALEAPVFLRGQAVDVSGSVGVASFPEDGASAVELNRRADTAMYVAKQAGSGYAVFDPAMERSAGHGLSLLSELRRAVDANELYLDFQPKVVLGASERPAAEVLVRWNHPQRGIVPPSEFIPFAEQTGFIRVITGWVLSHALHQQAAWRAVGLDVDLNINISARDLNQHDLPGVLRGILGATGGDPRRICLEVTESAIMADPTHALESLLALHEMGFGLSIDDFGTGYSSLAYLKKLPVHELKIDRSFVMNLDRDEADACIVRSTIDLAHNMGLRVVAEGVETESVAGRLRALGCDQAQGYLFSRPLSANDYFDWATAPGAVAPAYTAEFETQPA